MSQCEKCGHENQPIFRFCLKCGAELPRDAAAAAVAPKPKKKKEPEKPKRIENCPHCGAGLPEDRRFCVACGREAVPAADTSEPRPEIGRMVMIRADGSDGDSWPLYEGITAIGSGTGDHVFTDDEMMSPHHADIVVEAGELRLFDRDSASGTFVRITDAAPLADGAQFRIGQQLLEVDLAAGASSDESWGEVARLSGAAGDEPARYPLEGENVFLGRERGHIVFPDDGYVSGSHAVLFRENDHVMIKDLDSSNGTYVRIGEPQQLASGRLVLLGAHLFRLELA